MIIKQLSVAIEDKAGQVWQVFQTLADSGINILSYSIADGTAGGTLRLIVDNVSRAAEALRAAGAGTQLDDVYSLNCPNETGSMSRVLRRIADHGISIDYMYAFQYRGISQAIIRARDMARLQEVLTEYERERLL